MRALIVVNWVGTTSESCKQVRRSSQYKRIQKRDQMVKEINVLQDDKRFTCGPTVLQFVFNRTYSYISILSKNYFIVAERAGNIDYGYEGAA